MMKARILALLMTILKDSDFELEIGRNGKGDYYVFTYSFDDGNTIQVRITEDMFLDFYKKNIDRNRNEGH